MMFSGSTQGRPIRHDIIVTYVGPYVRADCTCKEFGIVKRKELSQFVASEARIHIAKHRREERKAINKYDDYLGPDGASRNAAYRAIWYPSDATPCDPAMQHGGDLRHNSPRKEKHHRQVVEGLRVK